MKLIGLVALLLISLSVSAVERTEYIFPDESSLRFSRLIWTNNCEGCHSYEIADAPIPMQPQDWVHRVNKAKSLLYHHAIDGFIGEVIV